MEISSKVTFYKNDVNSGNPYLRTSTFAFHFSNAPWHPSQEPASLELRFFHVDGDPPHIGARFAVGVEAPGSPEPAPPDDLDFAVSSALSIRRIAWE